MQSLSNFAFFQVFCFQLPTAYWYLHKKRMSFRSNVQLFNNYYLEKKKNNQINDFVNRLLPQHIQKLILNPGLKNSKIYKNITMIFADISGFTKYSSGKKPKEVVFMLSKLFTKFDKECDALKLFKLYTIGDCYVAIGNLKQKPGCEFSAAKKVVTFGMKMIDIIRNVRKEIQFGGLEMRIGVHTGNVIGGLIGTDMIRFDIYGQDVIVANKMESKGTIGKINVSEQSKRLLERYHEFSYEYNKNIVVGEQEVKTYFVTKRNFANVWNNIG